jgi:DNA-binding response OmpR family regulator
LRILVVEDEKRLAAALRRGLQAEGFAVDIALDGEAGLRQAQLNSYDAIVLDIMLPGLNGYRVCAAIRENDDWTPILMLTAKDGELDEAEALDTGADDFLAKPFSYVVLVARLRALIRRGGPERPSVLTCGDLVLDPAGHDCRRREQPIHLTPREFAVLEYLMRRSGEVVSKTELLEHVWDFAYEGGPNIVEVNIANLRKKVDTPFDRAAIQTVRGVGYRVTPDGG